jgi:CRP-like cAMP-binding protein
MPLTPCWRHSAASGSRHRDFILFCLVLLITALAPAVFLTNRYRRIVFHHSLSALPQDRRKSRVNLDTGLLERFTSVLKHTIVEMAAGERLFAPGDAVRNLYFVSTGEMAAFRYQHDGKKAVLQRAGSGEFLLPYSLFLSSYTCYAEATSASRLVAIAVSDFQALLFDSPQASLEFTRTLAQSFQRECARQERLRLGRAQDRILHFLACEGDDSRCLHLAGTLAAFADELGLDHATLYRALKRLEAEGRIVRVGKQLKLV